MRLADVVPKWPGSIVAFGIHPWYAAETECGWLERLENVLVSDANAWVGETGLDGARKGIASEAVQERAFVVQLCLARRLNRLVNIHCVKAHEKLLALLDAEYLAGMPGRAFIAHSFSGPHQYVKFLAERGAYFTVGPLFSRRDSRRDRERVRLFPESGLLLESDAFLSPCHDATNELQHTLEWLAEARNMSTAALVDVLDDNTRRLKADA